MNGFLSLVYTDCRPGQGLSGGAGLQFQAVSDDTGGEAMALVQDHLLYEAPAAWMREQRPVEDYPPSFAHLGGDWSATAAGVYLGREANGTREGNQLTHAVATPDHHTYGLLRPAQLYGAPFWTAEPAPTTRCEPVDADPPPGPLDTETVHAFVRRHPDGARLLAALLTVLSRPDDGTTPRVLFVADQAEPVLTWIAAATLLLPHREAVRVGFKVFTTDPSRAAQRILAVHPGWDEPPATVDRPGGYLVVDLLAGRWSPIEAAPLATRWAETFCAGDPYDVTDAVELAGGSGLPPEAGAALARVAVLGEEPDPAYAETLVGWLTEGPRELTAAYGPPVAAAFTADVARQPLALLGKLDRATRSTEQAVPVRLALLTAELGAAATTGRILHRRIGPIAADAFPVEQARDLVVRHASTATEDRFAAVLTVAGIFGVPVRRADLGPAADAFVAHWATRPEPPYATENWPCGDELTDLLRDHLGFAVTRDPGRARTIAGRWHRHLEIRDPAAPLDATLIAEQLAGGDDTTRRTTVTTLVDRFPAEVPALARCLWRWTPPTAAELRIVVAALPAGAPMDAAAIDAYLVERANRERLDRADLDLVHDLVATHRLPAPLQGTRQMLDDDRALTGLAARLPGLEKPDATLTGRLSGLRAHVVRVHRDPLLDALLDTRVPAMVLEVLAATPDFQRPYAQRAADQLKAKPAATAVADAVVVACGLTDREAAGTLLGAVNKWVSWAGSGPTGRVTARLDTRSTRKAHEQWQQILETNRVRRGRAWLRGSKGH